VGNFSFSAPIIYWRLLFTFLYGYGGKWGNNKECIAKEKENNKFREEESRRQAGDDENIYITVIRSITFQTTSGWEKLTREP
jgi:hypothetical protein